MAGGAWRCAVGDTLGGGRRHNATGVILVSSARRGGCVAVVVVLLRRHTIRPAATHGVGSGVVRSYHQASKAGEAVRAVRTAGDGNAKVD
jgi:hypothetical protein